LATFRDGAFEVGGPGAAWRYERVPSDRVTKDLRPLVRQRKAHDYATLPN
jgi:hypothetical protein